MDATSVADAVGDGTCDLDTDEETVTALSQLLGQSHDLGIKRRLLDLPAFKRSPRRQKHSQGVQQQTWSASTQPATADSTDLLGCLLPQSDPEDDDAKSWPKPCSEEDTALTKQLVDAAHQLLTSDPCAVLKSMLQDMFSHSVRSAILAPYMLVLMKMCKQIRSRPSSFAYPMAALDIEKFTVQSGKETWPSWAELAAAGVSPVIPVLEFGYAWAGIVFAVQAQETLDQAEEAKTGMCGSSLSGHYRNDSKATAVNGRAVSNINNPARAKKPTTSRTARAALVRCLGRLARHSGGAPTLTHNSSGFDERACLKILLMPGCESRVGSAQEQVWHAAEDILRGKGSVMPAFYPGYRPLRLLLKVLWQMLKQSSEHSELIRRAVKAKFTQLPLRLEWVSQVHCLANPLLHSWLDSFLSC